MDSPWLPSLKLQKNEAIAQTEQDPILNRTMGAILRGDNLVSVSDTELKTAKPAHEVSLRIHVLTQITDTPEQWLAALEKQAAAIEKMPAAQRWREHCRWWNEFWNRSWIFVEGSRSLAHAGQRASVARRRGFRRRQPVRRHDYRAARDRTALSAAEIANLPRSNRPPKRNSAKNAMTTGCTVAAWIKPAAGEAGRILDKCTAGKPDGITFDTHPGLSLRWIVGNDTMIQPNCLKAGEWQHVAATVDAGTGVRRIYLNGKLVKEERGDSDAETLTRGYTLQRWINACGGRGAFPIKFNGSIFVVDNKFDADYRAWGGGYWFQNTRLPYWSDAHRRRLRPDAAVLRHVHEGAAGPQARHQELLRPRRRVLPGNHVLLGQLPRPGRSRLRHQPHRQARRPDRQPLHPPLLAGRPRTGRHDARLLRPHAGRAVPRRNAAAVRHAKSSPSSTSTGSAAPTARSSSTRAVAGNLVGLHQPARRRSPACATSSRACRSSPATPRSRPPGRRRSTTCRPSRSAPTAKRRLLPAEKFANKHNSENPELYAVFPYRLYTLAAGEQRPGHRQGHLRRSAATRTTAAGSRTPSRPRCWA